LVLHGAGVDHREPEACFEPILEPVGGLRRVYPDLPGMGRSPAPESVRSSDDVLDLLLRFAHEECGTERFLLIGHSAGAYFAQAMAARIPDQVTGLAMVCPLLPQARDVPEPGIVAGPGGLGDAEFAGYFVVQTPQMLDRYERFVAPATKLVDEEAMERIGERWLLRPGPAAYAGPTLVVAGRWDSAVGHAAAVDLLDVHPRATLAVIDDAGHALPHEEPAILGALVRHWIARTVG